MIKQLEEIRDTLFEFLETRINLFQVETRERIEKIILQMIYIALVLSLTVVILTFLLLLLANYLNQVLQNPYAGYLIIIGFFSLSLLLCLVFRKPFIRLLRYLLENILKK